VSTVLWANELVDGAVTSDESDKYALYEHADKLDAISRRLHQKAFMELIDTTDLEFNQGNAELPQGMTSTNELMAKTGKWLAASEAANLLVALISDIETNKVRFGMLKNDHDVVVAELKESLAYALSVAEKNGRFNFSVVA
jgi:hypothetical protein